MAANFPPRRAPVSDDDLAPPSDFESPMPAPERQSQTPRTHVVTPESVHYHEQTQRCDMCDHMSQDNQCAVLSQEVSPEGGCDAFRASSDHANDDDMSDGTAEDDDDSDVDDDSDLDGPRGGYGS